MAQKEVSDLVKRIKDKKDAEFEQHLKRGSMGALDTNMAAVSSSFRRPRTAGTFVRFANDQQHEQERALRERLAAHPGKIVGVGAEFESVITSQFSKY